MKTCSFKIIVAILASSLGVFVFWSVGGFSHLASLFESEAFIQKVSAQTNEVPSKLTSNKNKSVDILKLKYPFKNYPVTAIYKGKVAPLKLSRGEKEGVIGEKLQYTIDNFPKINFAGHYIAATWSCGMWCDWSAFIDAKTGEVYWWKGITSYCFPDLDKDFVCNEDFSSVEYKTDSKLIIFFGYKNGEAGSRGSHYYKFENGRFIHLKSVLVEEQRSQSEILTDEAGKKTDDEKSPEK